MNPSKLSMVITGSSRGIGKVMVQTYLEHGWNIFGCSRGASDVVHDRYQHFELDVTDEPALLKMFAAVRKSKKPLYAQINNAGIASMNHVLTTPYSTMKRVFGVNVFGTMLCSREAGKQMILHKRGRIINFGSVAVPYALEGETVYTASKAAVEMYTKVLANELGDNGVTANCVSPNPVKTDLIAGVPVEKMDALVQRQAIKRYGKIEDVINAVDFLLQPTSDFITGQVIYLGGP